MIDDQFENEMMLLNYFAFGIGDRMTETIDIYAIQTILSGRHTMNSYSGETITANEIIINNNRFNL